MNILNSINWRNIGGALTAALLLTSCANQSATPSDTGTSVTRSITFPSEQAQQLFALDQVSLDQGPFAHAQRKNVQYLLAMKPDKLLAPYLREAGLTPDAKSYGNWESSGLDGHIGGHYLSALSLAWAATGDEELKRRLVYMLDKLKLAQDANGGYLGGIPDGEKMWAEIKSGNINADLFSLNDRWVPLYNIDKIFHGLRDAYLIGESEQAKTMLFTLGEWMLDITAELSDEQIQKMLYSEHGALNAVFADMATISGDDRYMELARQFSHQRILDPLLQKQDKLTGLHANTQIPKIIGMLKVADATDDEAWQEASKFFWNTVTKERSVSIGGNSVREHFHDSDDFTPMVEDIEGPETCNTYNMLKLSKLLFLRTGDTRYLDFYERATYNHILSSQHPEHGGLVYFTSMRPGHYRTYSSVEDSMWCCVGSGIENHSKYGELIYTYGESELRVNLFIPSTLQWQQAGWEVTQETRFPDNSAVSLTFNALTDEANKTFTLQIRQPVWLSGNMKVSINGEAVKAASRNGFIEISRKWRNGDMVSFNVSGEVHTEQLPDGQDYYSVLYGPVVLATRVQAFENEQLDFVADDSRMGHIAAGPVCPPQALPVMLAEPDVFVQSLTRLPGDKLAFKTTKHVAIGQKNEEQASATLIPFFRLHDSRYQVYWPQLSQTEFQRFVTDAQAQAEQSQQLAADTVDQVTPGQQQPEVEHDFAGEHTRAGVNNGMHWRDATGWFEYRLDNSEKRARVLRITYFKGDTNRNFTIKVNSEVLAEVTLPHGQPDGEASSDFYTVSYPLTYSMQDAPTLLLRFEAAPGSIAGGIYGIRLMAQ